MKSIVVDNRLFRSIKAYADESGHEYHRIMFMHINSGGSPYFFEGHHVRLATEEEVSVYEPGDYITRSRKGDGVGVSSYRSGGPLIRKPITSGISTNWGDY